MLSDFLFVAPHDQICKLLVAENVPVYMYVLNTTITSIPLPEWRLYSHDTEYYFLTGAPFMDSGMIYIIFINQIIIYYLCNHVLFRLFPSFASYG